MKKILGLILSFVIGVSAGIAVPAFAHDFDLLNSLSLYATRVDYGKEFFIRKTTSGDWKIVDTNDKNGEQLRGTRPDLYTAAHDVDAALRGGSVPTATAVVPTPTTDPMTSPLPTPTQHVHPTSTPSPTGVPTSTLTTVGRCGESMFETHPRFVNGCDAGHFHGPDAPAWVINYEVSLGNPMPTHILHGSHNTSDKETQYYLKHIAMHTYAGTFNTTSGPVDAFCSVHGDEMPVEWATELHSYKCWLRYNNKVSNLQGWYYTGLAKDVSQGGTRMARPPELPSDRPIWAIPARSTPNLFGQFYATCPGEHAKITDKATGAPLTEFWCGYAPDFGLNIGTVTAFYSPNFPTFTDDIPKWDLTGKTGYDYTLEAFSWYADRWDSRGVFYTTQFGGYATSCSDPMFGKVVTIDGKDYTTVCLRQEIQPDLPSITFLTTGGKNSLRIQDPAQPLRRLTP